MNFDEFKVMPGFLTHHDQYGKPDEFVGDAYMFTSEVLRLRNYEFMNLKIHAKALNKNYYKTYGDNVTW